MPRLPGAEALGNRPTPTPAGGMARYSGENPAAGAQGSALMQMGADTQRTANEIHAQFKVEEDRQNTLRAEDAFTKLRQRQLDLTMGEQEGFVNARGADAVNRPLLQDYKGKFEQATKEISEGLSNEQQRTLFMRRAAVSGLQFQENILQHVLRESDVYAKQVYDGTLATEVRAASAAWQDPTAIGLSIERINAAIATRATAAGWGKEISEAERLRAMGAVHSSVIEQALAAGNYVYAQEYFKEHREDVDKNTAKALFQKVEQGTQKQLSAAYTADLLANRKDPRGLEDLEKRLLSDTTLDETRKNALLGSVLSRRDALERQQAAARERWERNIDRQLTAINTLTLQGYEPTPEQMLPLVNATKGTPLEGQVNRMIATAQITRAFRQATPQQQEAALTDMEIRARQDPTKADVQAIGRLRQIQENQRRDARADPTTFAVRQGFVDADNPAAKPLDLTKPEALGTNLQARFELARQVAARYGVPVKPLTAAEADLLQSSLKGASPQAKRDYFGRLAQATAGDRQGYSAVMAQIAPDDPVTAIGGVRAGQQLTTPTGKNVAELIFAGQAVLHPNRKEDGNPSGGKTWPMPKEAELLKAFQAEEGDAFAGYAGARNGFYQTAQAIYAAQSVQAGDASGLLNRDRWKESIKLATGGFATYQGKRTVVPWGYDDAAFVDGLNKRLQQVVASGRLADTVTFDKVRSLPVEAVGDGRYVFRSGDGVVVDKQNRPVVIDFNQPAPYMPSGYGKEPIDIAPPTPAEIAAASRPARARVKDKQQ